MAKGPYVMYSTRRLRADLHKRMKFLGFELKMSLEELLNYCLEMAIPVVEERVRKKQEAVVREESKAGEEEFLERVKREGEEG